MLLLYVCRKKNPPQENGMLYSRNCLRCYFINPSIRFCIYLFCSLYACNTEKNTNLIPNPASILDATRIANEFDSIDDITV